MYALLRAIFHKILKSHRSGDKDLAVAGHHCGMHIAETLLHMEGGAGILTDFLVD